MNPSNSTVGTATAVSAPLPGSERSYALDALRGVAVLGILVVNIQTFSMPDPTWANPTVYGDLTGVNYVVWLLTHLLAELKFMAIFSMVFGAGIVLMSERLDARGGCPGRVHYRRMAALLGFGVLHAYGLWTGDILVWYAITGMLVYPLRRLRPATLLALGLLLLLAGTALYGFFQWSQPYWPPEARQGALSYWQPPPELVQHRLEVYRGGWREQMALRVPAALGLHTFVYAVWASWRIAGLMVLGMGLMKLGVFTAGRNSRFYLLLLTAGLPLGLGLTGWGAARLQAHSWSADYSMFGGSLFNYWGSLATSLAWVAAVMLICRARPRGWLVRHLAPVGRMAFTCYILQTLICTTLFFGHGLGLYGRVERWGQMLVVLAVWALLVPFASAWLRRFRFGPLEGLWRRLTYGRRAGAARPAGEAAAA
jgi:uncharacterized protein